jgi:hypothetical protein
MEVTDAGMWMEVSAVVWNALFPIVVTLEGIMIEVTPVLLNEDHPIFVH